MNSLFPDFSAVPRRFFLDMNSFYCSVEQQEVEALRGKPTIVVPVMTTHTCAIAASYCHRRVYNFQNAEVKVST